MIVTPGVRIDRYEIVRAVASGGMGTVWLARMSGVHGFAKRVAVKTILPDLANDARARAMFVDEARTAMRIEHPNVAQVLDVGEHAGVLYIAFEWIDGASLEHLCAALEARGEVMPVPHVLRIAADACAGLAAAHDLCDAAGAPLGVVHRDVSPHNILVSRAGTAKLIDFGIAKVRDRLGGETDAGIVRGKRGYMAPEQLAGRPVDRRADIWAMGATICRALCGPVLDDPAAYAAVVAGAARVPAAVRAVVVRALAPAPDERYQTASDLQRALDDATDSRITAAEIAARFAGLIEPPHEEPPAPLAPTVPAGPAARVGRPRRGRIAIGIGALAIASAGVIVWQASGDDREPPVPVPLPTPSAVPVAAPTSGSAAAPGSASSAPPTAREPAPARSGPPLHRSPRFRTNDAVSYRDRGEWRDAIVEGMNRDGTIAIHVLGATRSQRDVASGELRPRKRLPPLPIGQTVRFGQLTCTIAAEIATEQYTLACPFGHELYATRSSLSIAD
jgi:serine/threonine-protein kinase